MISRAFRPVRNRLVIAVVMLVAGSLVGAGWALYIVESRRLDREVNTSLDREIAAFRSFEKLGTDPSTGAPFSDPATLVQAFLQRSIPLDDAEVLWSFTSQGPPRYVGTPPTALSQSDALAVAVAKFSESGGMSNLAVGGHDYRVVVIPVLLADTDQRVAFVITHDVTATRQPLTDLMRAAAVIGLIAIAVITFLSAMLLAGMLRPLHRMLRTADAIGAGSLDARIDVTGSGDLADLQRAFNGMLDRLESAFSAQRRMLDDAGHELRTPLTIVRGHLEVLDPEDPQDVRATRDLLISETARMSRLVTDLLMLAKSDRPDFITLRQVDVGTLTRGIVTRSSTLAPRYWKLGAVADGPALLDADRITQAMLQLAENSARYTKVGGTIEFGSRFLSDQVEFWVRDDGPGVDPSIRSEIFSRFSTTQQDHEGFGLGLSIVRAIVEAHHGTIHLEDTNRGALFRISIPRGAGR